MSAYPITDKSLERLRLLVAEAQSIAASIRDSGPVGVRFEASNIVAGLGDVDEMVRDTWAALQEIA